MGVMGIPMTAVLVMTLVLLCGSAVVAVFDGYNGMPRPAGMDQDPTTTYGSKPAVQYEKKAAKCIWYGWENGNYPPDGTHNCSTSLWASLSASNPEGLSAFMYYVPLDNAYFDPLYNEYLCAIGCFDLTASGPAAVPVSPPTANPPAPGLVPPVALPPVVAPPVEAPPVEAPPVEAPPVEAPPPPVETTAPPSEGATLPPLPATLFRPPPPAAPLPPSPTPTTIVEPPIESAPSPAISPEASPEASPLSSPGSSPIFSPGTGPGPTAGGPLNVVQGNSATTTSVPAVLVFTAVLFLCINFLV